MPQVIDFKTKSKVSEDLPTAEEEFPTFLDKVLQKENVAGMKSGIVILWGEESTDPMIWSYNADDRDVLWFSEMLREMALYPSEDEEEYVDGA